MPNIASVLKSEISRLARKETRGESDRLKKAVSAQRAEIVALKRRLAEVEKMLAQMGKASRSRASLADQANEPGAPEPRGSRFSAKGLASNRKRLGLSAADFGLLVGVSGQAIYLWEAGKTRPREEAIAAIIALRGIGKQEAAARLEQLKAQTAAA